MVNFHVDPALLEPYVPAGTELDFCGGDALLSVVGFRFLNTRVRGFAIPLHRDFEEVNLRMYVRCDYHGETRHGVTFIRELVPRRAIALVARAVYNEPYVAVPMTSDVVLHGGQVRSASYGWRTAAGDCQLTAEVAAQEPRLPAYGSEACFVTEHYWGYTRQRDGSTIEYKVQHPRWNVCPASKAHLRGGSALFPGSGFANVLEGEPCSAWVSEGSAVTVFSPRTIGARRSHSQ